MEETKKCIDCNKTFNGKGNLCASCSFSDYVKAVDKLIDQEIKNTTDKTLLTPQSCKNQQET